VLAVVGPIVVLAAVVSVVVFNPDVRIRIPSNEAPRGVGASDQRQDQIEGGQVTTGEVVLSLNAAAAPSGASRFRWVEIMVRSIPASGGDTGPLALLLVGLAEGDGAEVVDLRGTNPGTSDLAGAVVGGLDDRSPVTGFQPDCEDHRPCDLRLTFELRPLDLAVGETATVPWQIDARVRYNLGAAGNTAPRGATVAMDFGPSATQALDPAAPKLFELAELAAQDELLVDAPLGGRGFLVAENDSAASGAGNAVEFDPDSAEIVGGGSYVVHVFQRPPTLCERSADPCELRLGVDVPAWAEGRLWVDRRAPSP
jgi:hypothetical protein